MPKYVVKNERGEWLWSTDDGLFDWITEGDRDEWVGSAGRASAFKAARRYGGKVYRVRKMSARRERDAIVALLKRRRDALKRHSIEWVELDLAIQEVEARHAER